MSATMEFPRRWSLLALIIGVMVILPGHSQTTSKPAAKLEAIAETRLLMDGLALANFKGLERKLSPKPADGQEWIFARGQALLIAETANLLMLRPPKTQGQTAWFERSTDLRNQAQQLARDLANKDLERSRSGLRQLANSCNRCHQTFRVSVEITPFQPPDGPSRKVE